MSHNKDVATSHRARSRLVTIALISGWFFLTSASAQFSSGIPGQMNLPQNDFTWTWGSQRPNPRDLEDISMFGNDSGFSCDLKGKLRVNSQISRMDVRSLESEIRGNMSFVQAASYAMNDLDSRRELDWATLVCKKPEPKDDD